MWMLAGISVFTGSAMTTGAYLTKRTINLKNMLSPGTVTIELKEPDWKTGESMLPAESRSKNPTVKNTGTVEAWIFLEVDIPVKKISLVDMGTKRKLPEARTEVFQFTVNKGWKLLQKTETPDTVHYVYGYDNLVSPFRETTALFDQITIVPYLEGSLDEKESLQIPVEAKAIQKNIAPDGTGLKEIYQQYLHHEKNAKEEHA